MTAGITFQHVSWADPRAIHLRDLMTTEPGRIYPELSRLCAPDAPRLIDVGADGVVATILPFAGAMPVAHAAIRLLENDLEVKRVFVQSGARRTGVGGELMAEVESTAGRLGAKRLILHTGNRQPAAIKLYRRLGYRPIPVYEPYATTMPNSFCFEKDLTA